MGANVSFHEQLTEEEITVNSKLKSNKRKSEPVQSPTILQPTTCGATFGKRKKYRKTRNTLRTVIKPDVNEYIGDVLKENNAPSPERPAHGSGDINWDKQRTKKVFKSNKDTVNLNDLVPSSSPSILNYLGKCSFTYNTMSSARKDFPNDVYMKTAFKEPNKPKNLLSNVTYMDTAHLRNVCKAETKRVSLPFIQRQRLSKENASKQKSTVYIEGVKFKKKKSHHQLLKELLKKEDLSDAELVPVLRKSIDHTKEDKAQSDSRDVKEEVLVCDKKTKRASSGSQGLETYGNEKNVGKSKVGLSISNWEMQSKSNTEMKNDKSEKRSSLKQMNSSSSMKNVSFEEKKNNVKQSPSSKSNADRKQYSEAFVLDTSPAVMRASVFGDSPMLRNRASLGSRSGNEEVFSSHSGLDNDPPRRLTKGDDLVNIVPPRVASNNSEVSIVVPPTRSSINRSSSKRMSNDRRMSDDRRMSNERRMSTDRRQSNNDYDITIENLQTRKPRDSIPIQENSPNNSDDILVNVTGPQTSSDNIDPPTSQEGMDVISLKPLRNSSSSDDERRIPIPPPMLIKNNSNVYEEDSKELVRDAVSVDDLCSKSVRTKNKMFESMLGPRRRQKSGKGCVNNYNYKNVLENGETSLSRALKIHLKSKNVCPKENSYTHSPSVFTPWDRGMICNAGEGTGISGRCRESTTADQGTCYEEPVRNPCKCLASCSNDSGPLERFNKKGKDCSKLDPERVTHFQNAFRRTMRHRADEASGSGEDSYHYMGGVCSLCGTERRKNKCSSAACCDKRNDPRDVKLRCGRAAKSVCTLCGSERVRLCSPECLQSPNRGQPAQGCVAARPNRPRFQPNKGCCIQNCKCPMCLPKEEDSSTCSVANSRCARQYSKVLKMFEEKSSQYQKDQKKDCRRKSPCVSRKKVPEEKCLCSPQRRKSRDCVEQRRKPYEIEKEIRDDQVVTVKEYYEEPKGLTKQCYKQPACSNKQMKRKTCKDFCEPIHESFEYDCPRYRRCDEDEEEEDEEPQWEKKESSESIDEDSKEDLGCGAEFYDENGSYLEGKKCGESVVKLRQLWEGPKQKLKNKCCDEDESRYARKKCSVSPPRKESCYCRPPCEAVCKVSPPRRETCKPCQSVDKVRRARTPRGEGCRSVEKVCRKPNPREDSCECIVEVCKVSPCREKSSIPCRSSVNVRKACECDEENRVTEEVSCVKCRSPEKVCRKPNPREDSCECIVEVRSVSPCREKSSKQRRSSVNVRKASKHRDENCECDEVNRVREEASCAPCRYPETKIQKVLVTRNPPPPPQENFDEYHDNAGPGWKLSDQSDARSVTPRAKRCASPSEASYQSHYAKGSCYNSHYAKEPCRPLRGILKNSWSEDRTDLSGHTAPKSGLERDA